MFRPTAVRGVQTNGNNLRETILCFNHNTIDMEHSSIPPLRTESLGERSVVLRVDHATAVDRLREAATEVGFTVLSEFVPSERINAELDAAVESHTVVGLGVPAAAEHALDVADPRVAALFPCRVVIREIDDGTQELYYLNTMRLAREVGLAPEDDRWGALVAQVDRMIDDALSALDEEGVDVERSP